MKVIYTSYCVLHLNKTKHIKLFVWHLGQGVTERSGLNEASLDCIRVTCESFFKISLLGSAYVFCKMSLGGDSDLQTWLRNTNLESNI